jgi:hypothetical protein
MAKGFESKDVEFQQAEADRGGRAGVRRTLTSDEREEAAKRQSIELALSRARSELAHATSAAHRRMLDQAIVELERQLAVHA